jgi:hypothetical protein
MDQSTGFSCNLADQSRIPKIFFNTDKLNLYTKNKLILNYPKDTLPMHSTILLPMKGHK